MNPQTSPGEVIRGVAAGTSRIALDVLGPTVEFLTSPVAAHHDFCVMRGMIPPGVAVPLHSHDATEVFFVLSGTKQVLTLGSGPAEWVDVRAGDYVYVPRGVRHAHRNVSAEPLVELVITTARLGNWFEEVGTPATGAAGRRQPRFWIISSPCPGSTATGSARPTTTPPSASACPRSPAVARPAPDAGRRCIPRDTPPFHPGRRPTAFELRRQNRQPDRRRRHHMAGHVM